MARRATAIAQFRQQAEGPVLLLDAGNSLFALRKTLSSDPSEGALPVQGMNAMQYDALALGERDLAVGLELVQQRYREASFPILAANVTGTAGVLPNVQPYLLRSLEGHNIAIIGVAAPAVAARAQALGLALTVEDPATAVQRVLDEIAGQADVVIVLSNLAQQSNEALAQKVPGLAAIIGVAGGRPWEVRAIEGPAGRVVLHASYVQGEYLGFLTIGFDAAGRVVQSNGRIVPLDPSYANDPEMAALMRSHGVNP